MDNSNPTPITPNSDVPIEPVPNKKHKIIFFEIIFGVLCLILAGYIIIQHTENSANLRREVKDIQLPSSSSISGNYDVIAKENKKDKLLTDIYLKDKKTEKEMFFITLSEIERNDYYIGEFHNGNLYIVTSTGANNAYMKNPNWTDTLWRYNSEKKREKLYEVKGLDFRVSEDEKYIAIRTNDYVKILNNEKKVLKSYTPKELGIPPEVNPLMAQLESWNKHTIWLHSAFGPTLYELVKIDVDSTKVTKFDLSNLPIGSESDLNTEKELLAFSNYPAIFDVDSGEEYEKSGKKVNLIVYDLKSKAQQLITTSITKPFMPKWINKDTLEYNDPSSNKKISKEISFTDLSSILIATNLDIKVILKDTKGRIFEESDIVAVGYTGIKNGDTMGGQTLYFPNPETEQYIVEFSSTRPSTTSYKVEFFLYDKEGNNVLSSHSGVLKNGKETVKINYNQSDSRLSNIQK